MAMVIRSPPCITAWTSAKISRLEPPRARNPHQQMDQGRPLPSLSRAFWRTALAHYPQQFGRQSRRVSPARHRGLDPALSCLHFLTYLGPDQSFDLAAMWKDVAKRPFITVGFAGFVLLIPLAITSTAGWIRRLGGKRWQQLHRAIYITAVCGVIHYYWLVKSDVRKPLFYAALVGVLLLWRLGDWLFKRGSAVGVKLSPQRAPANPSR